MIGLAHDIDVLREKVEERTTETLKCQSELVFQDLCCLTGVSDNETLKKIVYASLVFHAFMCELDKRDSMPCTQ